jgi:hypothetical protein
VKDGQSGAVSSLLRGLVVRPKTRLRLFSEKSRISQERTHGPVLAAGVSSNARFKETQMFAAVHSRKNYLTKRADVILREK